jgi:integrase
MPKVDNLVTEQLDGEQLKYLLKAIAEDQHEQAGPMMKVALFTGMRRSEIFRLKWQDLDFENEQIRLTNTKSGKTKFIPMNELSKPLFKSIPKNSELVFPGRNGKQWGSIGKSVNKIKERAGLPRSFRSLHGLRHSFATMLAGRGVDLLTISKLLGHSDVAVTQRYAHLTDKAKQQASNIAAEVIKQAAE